jgi:hypothetical protein
MQWQLHSPRRRTACAGRSGPSGQNDDVFLLIGNYTRRAAQDGVRWPERHLLRHAGALLATDAALWRPALDAYAACPTAGRDAAASALAALPAAAELAGGGAGAVRRAAEACAELGLGAQGRAIAECAPCAPAACAVASAVRTVGRPAALDLDSVHERSAFA